MDIRFQPNNSHLENAAPADFKQTDPHLRRLYLEKFIFHSELITELPTDVPGIITLGGGRQIGKTTLLKQWMHHLLVSGVSPYAICFFSGELINDHQSLYGIIQDQLVTMPSNTIKYIILDEVTYINQWDKAIKYLADIGVFEQAIVVLSGSDLVLMEEARKRFPGRRGKLENVDFHYYPLSFREFLGLKKCLPDTKHIIQQLPELYQQFDQYLIHGGFLTAINEYAQTNSISNATLRTYSDWIRGDVLKRNKKENFLREITSAIIKYYTKQVSWDNLVKELSIDHTQTVSDYMHLLASMDAAFIQSAIIEEKLLAAPKKRKRLMFCDPFILHAMKTWLTPTTNPFETHIKPMFADPILYSELVESCVITQFRRFFPTYYIKAEGDVDIAYVHNNRFWPVEIKWTNQIRPKDLKQIRKYNNGEIYANVNALQQLDNLPVKPLPLALLTVLPVNHEI